MKNADRRPPGSGGASHPGRIPQLEPPRRQAWAQKSPQEILDKLRPGRADPLKVLEILIELFNDRHTARAKTVSHKTRQERGQFLRRFFRDLQRKAGFHTIPDPRNLGQKHIHAMVQVWQREQLAPATVQTYLSFLRGLALWLNKPGFIRAPSHYGLQQEEYQRHEVARHDKSWRAHGLDVDEVIGQVRAFDPRIAASMRLMHALGLRRKESVMFRPHEHVVAFAMTGLPDAMRETDEYVWTRGKGGRKRWLPVQTSEQKAAVADARALATSTDAHMGNPAYDLKRNLRRLDYALAKFGITRAQVGTTGHGLRHGYANDLYEEVSGYPSPVRGGSDVPKTIDEAARRLVSARVGHARLRAASAYIGSTKHGTTGKLANDPDPKAPGRASGQ